jgi:hypothetical protein
MQVPILCTRVKPAVFDLLLSAVIASYLGLIYLLLQNSSAILSVLASLVRYHTETREYGFGGQAFLIFMCVGAVFTCI